MNIAIAVDGPAGAGKSTIARMVAKKLGFVYIDTGAMYRAVTYGCLKAGFDPLDEARTTAALPGFDIRLTDDDRVFLNGVDVTTQIRSPEVSRLTSPVSAFLAVREHLVALQRKLAAKTDVVMDGRDIGTNVLPRAQVKVFMVASPAKRAERRVGELAAKGIKADYRTILAEINQRDYNDSHRAHNPLRQAPDAVRLDTTDMDVNGVVAKVLDIVREKTGRQA